MAGEEDRYHRRHEPMRWDQPSRTIRTEVYKPEKGQYLHPQWDPVDPSKRVNWPIAHREATRLQTFPDEFVWHGSEIEIARQIGNAVPPVLTQAIAEHLKPPLRGAVPPPREEVDTAVVG
ncbi:DNA cytosine methyltransferase [Streptomyces sp. NPDC020719]|uniref:DNA cytosine methyltransferase n=1 Tax=Streptomyces sp. NPDC020719 TaxID=3154896 RepID=UPI0033DB6BD1